MLILGHRGAMAHYPENTLLGITSALSDERVAGVEFDVRLTADGVAMVFHDKTLERLTGAEGVFDLHTFDELRDLRTEHEPIPTLAEVIAAWRRLRPAASPQSLNVELKPSNNFRALVSVCRRVLDPIAGPDRETTPLVVSSFDPRVLQEAQATGTQWRLGLLYDKPEGLVALRHLAEPDRIDLHPHHGLLTEAAVQAHQTSGRAFRCWTVDDPADARRVRALGCAAVISNRPFEMAVALRA